MNSLSSISADPFNMHALQASLATTAKCWQEVQDDPLLFKEFVDNRKKKEFSAEDTKTGHNALEAAAKRGYTEVVRTIIVRHSYSYFSRGNALALAIAGKHDDTILFLLKIDAYASSLSDLAYIIELYKRRNIDLHTTDETGLN